MATCTPELQNALKQALQGTEVEAQLVASGEEGLCERTLCRWLRARKGDVKKAAEDLKAHGAWRAQTLPKGSISDEEIANELSQDKAFWAGWDKHGHPTMVARVSNHKAAKVKEDFIKFMIYSLDLAVHAGELWEMRTGKAWDGKTAGVLNMKGLKLANYDGTALLTIFSLLGNHYVERLHKMYLYCAPSFFSGMWAVVVPFLDPVTRAKVQFVGEEDAETIFAQDYEPGVLPAEVGGTGVGIPLPQARTQLEGERAQLLAAKGAQQPPKDANPDAGATAPLPAGCALQVTVSGSAS